MNQEDQNLFVKFYSGAIEMKHASQQAGHPVFKDVDFISIVVPGDASSVVDRPASQNDITRFQEIYDRYKRNETEQIEGWKLESWPRLTQARVYEMKHLGFHTVEQLAMASDAQIGNVMEGQSLRAEAQAAVETAKDTATVQRFAAENEKLRADIEDLKQQIAAIPKRGKAA